MELIGKMNEIIDLENVLNPIYVSVDPQDKRVEQKRKLLLQTDLTILENKCFQMSGYMGESRHLRIINIEKIDCTKYNSMILKCEMIDDSHGGEFIGISTISYTIRDLHRMEEISLEDFNKLKSQILQKLMN